MSIKKPCKHPLCSQLTSSRHGYCRDHLDYRKDKRKEADSSRPNRIERGYTKDWIKLREEWLRGHPVCFGCGRINRQRPLLVHHVVPIADGGEALDPDNLRTYCGHCHDREHRRLNLEKEIS